MHTCTCMDEDCLHPNTLPYPLAYWHSLFSPTTTTHLSLPYFCASVMLWQSSFWYQVLCFQHHHSGPCHFQTYVNLLIKRDSCHCCNRKICNVPWAGPSEMSVRLPSMTKPKDRSVRKLYNFSRLVCHTCPSKNSINRDQGLWHTEWSSVKLS